MAILLLIPIMAALDDLVEVFDKASDTTQLTTQALGMPASMPEPGFEPRNVSSGEQALAQDIANRLDQYEDRAEAALRAKTASSEQVPEAAGVRASAAHYRSIETSMPASTAAGIATPGVDYLSSIMTLVKEHEPQETVDLQFLVQQSTKLAASLIMPEATIPCE